MSNVLGLRMLPLEGGVYQCGGERLSHEGRLLGIQV